MEINQLIELVEKDEDILKALLIHLELKGLVDLQNRLNPTLSTCSLIDKRKTTMPTNPSIWIDKWRGKFNDTLNPYGLSMGIGNRQMCLERMELFIQKVGNDVEAIMDATDMYLKDCIDKGRKGKKPEFFILPQDVGKISGRDFRTGDLYEWYNKVLSGETNDDISITQI